MLISRRPEGCLIDVVPLAQAAAPAARVCRLDEVVASQAPLEVHVPLHRVRRAVGRIERERRRELRDVVEIGKERVDLQRSRDGRIQRELPVVRWNQARELQLVQVEVVVVDTKPGAHDHPLGEVVRKPEARTKVVEVLLQNSVREIALLLVHQRHERGGHRGRQRVVPDLACRGIERRFHAVLFGPRRQVFPPQSELKAQLVAHLPVVVDERRDGRRVVRRSGRAERPRAGRAVPKQIICDGISREVTVERKVPASRVVGQVFELAELRLQSEPERMAAERPAGRVRHAVDVLCRALRIAAFSLCREAGHRHVRASVRERKRCSREVPQTQIGRPVATVGTDWRVQVVRVVVPEAEFVDPRGREHPRVSDGEVPPALGQVGFVERSGLQLRSFVVHEPLEQAVAVVERLIGAHGCGIRVVDEVPDDRVVVRTRGIRRRNRRRQDVRELREPVRGDDVAQERAGRSMDRESAWPAPKNCQTETPDSARCPGTAAPESFAILRRRQTRRTCCA